MLNIRFVRCGIKPKLEKYLTIECCPLQPPQSLGSVVCSVHLTGFSHLLADTVQLFDLILRLLGLVLSQSRLHSQSVKGRVHSSIGIVV